MSYNQGGQQGYGQYNPYDQQGNPYAQQDQPYSDQGNTYGGQQPSYGGRPEPQQQGSSYYDQDVERRAGGYEMSNMNGNDPNRLLNETRAIDRALDDLQGTLDRLGAMHGRLGSEFKAESPVQEEVNRLTNEIISESTKLNARVKRLKSDPESGNPRNAPQVGKVDRRLKDITKRFQQAQRDHQKKQQETQARDLRIVHPDWSDAQVIEAAQDSRNDQIFSQALMSSDRRGQAQTAAQNVKTRHEAIKKIEQDMETIAQLYADMEAAVLQQEPAVTQIEQRGEEVTEHVAKANTELTGAVVKAKAARRKKWWCLGIVVLIIIIIAVVVAVAVTVTRN